MVTGDGVGVVTGDAVDVATDDGVCVVMGAVGLSLTGVGIYVVGANVDGMKVGSGVGAEYMYNHCGCTQNNVKQAYSIPLHIG